MMNHLRFEQADDGLGQRIVLGVAGGANWGIDTLVSHTFGVAGREVLASSITMVNQPLPMFSYSQSLFQSVQYQCCFHRRRYTPTYDTTCINIDNERNIDKARPGSE